MIGNDIVDLSLAAEESNWQRKGFLEKVFSREERSIIFSVENCQQMVWLLWSFKEAAYKAHQRLTGHPPVLNWLRQKCRIISISESSSSGIVTINDKDYFTSSEITSEYIHTTARNHQMKPLKNVLFEGPSAAAREQLLKQVGFHFSVNPKELFLCKNSFGIPYVKHQNKTFFTDFSFSDHGRFSGFSVSLRIS